MNAKRIQRREDIDDQVMCYWKDLGGNWWLYIPGAGTGVLNLHTITENKDGTITVTPSILMMGHHGKQVHGYLTAGVWTDA